MSDDPMLRVSFAHQQSPREAVYYVKNRFKLRQRWRRVVEQLPVIPTVAEIADPDRLISIYHDMKQGAGQAPGPDGLTYRDLSSREVADLLRGVSASISAGTYRPGPTKAVSIPKLGGGHRTLHLRNIVDRVVSASLAKGLEDRWEGIFLPCSYGFRRHSGVRHMLAEMARTMESQQWWVVAQDDIRNAFPSVPIGAVLADHARYIEDRSLLGLIEVVLRGNDNKREVGIDQGCPYSPTALNARLYHAADHAVHGPYLLQHHRYVDNLVEVCGSVSEGNQILCRLRQILKSNGFDLKGEDRIKDLKEGQSVNLLGFRLFQRNGVLQFDLGPKAWKKLKGNLVQAHMASNPTQASLQVVRGWIDAYGPALGSWLEISHKLLQTLAAYGFREISHKAIANYCAKSWNHWKIVSVL